MSLDATRWAWQQRVGKSSAKTVLLSLADLANARDECYPSIPALVFDTELNRKTVIANLDYLEKIGLIEDSGNRVGRTGQVKVYRLLGVEHRHKANSPESGTLTGIQNPAPLETPPHVACETGEQSQNRNSPKTGTLEEFSDNSSESGPVSEAKSTDFGSKESQKRPERVPKTGHGSYQEPIRNHKTPSPSAEGHRESMPEDWLPSRETHSALNLQGVPPGFAYEQLMEFRLYWRDDGRGKTSWNAAFYDRCLRQWRGKGHEWRARQQAGGDKTEAEKLIDRYTDRSWATHMGRGQ